MFFPHNSKKFAEFQKLVDFLNTKDNKILQNVKTHWISMFSPSKRTYYEYQPFILKMHTENPKSDTTSKNLNVLCDEELILGLPCLLPLLECVDKLIKIVQGLDIFVCDLVKAIKLAQLELYMLYCHSFTNFEDATFDDFNAIGNLTNVTMLM
jgi:hypothetical protein